MPKTGLPQTRLALTVSPLTPDLWPALEDLFGPKGGCNHCWCMYWRIGAAYRRAAPGANKRAFHQVVKQGPPPGLLALEGERAVGWCQLTPRAELVWLEHQPRLRRLDDLAVWCLSCFYVRIGYRKRGVTKALIAAAIEYAKQTKAPALEAYPLDPALTPSSSSTGFVNTFLRAGFQKMGAHVPQRPILRLNLR